MPAFINLVGLKFGRLTVLNRTTGNGVRFLCRCDCGNETIVQSGNLRTGHTQSCGCMAKEMTVDRETKHGYSKTKAHNTWCAMRSRCFNKDNKRYSYYGGRGITVCERWLVFENFLADMGVPELHQSIDRIDNDGNYSPENCRWTDVKTQSRNRRSNVLIKYKGEEALLADWAKRINCHPTKLHNKIKLLGVDNAIKSFLVD